MNELERMMCLILSLGKMLSENDGILRLPTDKQLEIAAKYLLANGVLLPPVRVGDTVYYIVGGYYKSPDNCKVSKPCKVVEISYKIGAKYRQLSGFITDKGTRYSFDGIGKTVFLTREEAEEALRKRKEAKNE